MEASCVEIVDNNPTVYRLEVHTEGNHTGRGEEQPTALIEAHTKLKEWFKANIQYRGENHLRYDEFPRFFTWNRSDKVCKPRVKFRKRGSRGAGPLYEGAYVTSGYNYEGSGETVIGRMFTVSPREGERYFLRMLIPHVNGAKSFADMRTVDGEVCSSFRQACSHRGLLG